jgi:hypothetical protein
MFLPIPNLIILQRPILRQHPQARTQHFNIFFPFNIQRQLPLLGNKGNPLHPDNIPSSELQLLLGLAVFHSYLNFLVLLSDVDEDGLAMLAD